MNKLILYKVLTTEFLKILNSEKKFSSKTKYLPHHLQKCKNACKKFENDSELPRGEIRASK